MGGLSGKTFVTHLKPHQDELAAYFLLRKFHPDFGDAACGFVSFRDPAYRGISADEDDDVVFVGIGGGRFDEHRGLNDECATTLVWKWILAEGHGPAEPIARRAAARFVEYVFRCDTGRWPEADTQIGDFTVHALTGALRAAHEDAAIMARGERLMALQYDVLLNRERAADEWDQRVEFPTPWGPGAGLETRFIHGAQRLAYDRGFVLVAGVDPQTGYRQIWAQAESATDLSQAFERARRREPDVRWYLHHSKRILLAGSDVAPDQAGSALSLAELIDLVREPEK